MSRVITLTINDPALEQYVGITLCSLYLKGERAITEQNLAKGMSKAQAGEAGADILFAVMGN